MQPRLDVVDHRGQFGRVTHPCVRTGSESGDVGITFLGIVGLEGLSPAVYRDSLVTGADEKGAFFGMDAPPLVNEMQAERKD